MRDPFATEPVGGGNAVSVVHPGAGLRLRLWLGLLLAGAAGAGAILGLLAWLDPADPLFDPRALGVWPWGAAFLCVALSVGLALWLDHGIASHLRGLSRALAGADPAGLGGLPASAGWGELSLLTAQLHGLIVRHGEMNRASGELEDLRHRIRDLRAAVESRPSGRPAEPLRPADGPLGPLVEALNRHRDEADRIEGGTRADALALRRGLAGALGDARASAEQAERGFVEATALLTTVRELQRLGGELQQGLSAAPVPAAPAPGAGREAAAEAQRRYREAATAAIHELVSASHESVERLAAGLAEAQEIGAQVQVLANRATLIALQVSLAGPAGARVPPDALSRELRTLAGEVRSVTDGTAERLAVLDREVAAASERMKGLRERVAARLDEAPPLPEVAPEPAGTSGRAAPAPPPEAAVRLLERVREMIQDAAAKGERLSATGERASRAAEHVVRMLEQEAGTLQALARRLGAGEAVPGGDAAPEAGPLRPGDLRLLGPEEPGPTPRVSPGPEGREADDAEGSR